MATTRLLTRHVDKGKTVKESLTESKDYALNPEKTKHQDADLVTGFQCDPKTADVEFHYAKKIYEQKTGRKQKNDVILYQFRQSFKPGEIMPEEANKIGYEWAMRFLKGKHAFYVSTHTDKAHIHNHIYWNSVTLDCTRKFRNFLGSGKAGRRLSDLICLEHNLSVIENPSRKKSKSKWADSRKKTQRELLEEMIDGA